MIQIFRNLKIYMCELWARVYENATRQLTELAMVDICMESDEDVDGRWRQCY